MTQFSDAITLGNVVSIVIISATVYPGARWVKRSIEKRSNEIHTSLKTLAERADLVNGNVEAIRHDILLVNKQTKAIIKRLQKLEKKPHTN